jgi:predicted SnoaL-like aldol condensation-catalyzing enzyme
MDQHYTPQEEANRRLVLAMYERVLQALDSSHMEEFFTSDYIQHNPTVVTGPQGLKAVLDRARVQSPLAEHRIKRVFVDGDYVIAHVHLILHPGELGRAVVDIFRIQDGKIAEHWDVAQPVPEKPANDNGMF